MGYKGQELFRTLFPFGISKGNHHNPREREIRSEIRLFRLILQGKIRGKGAARAGRPEKFARIPPECINTAQYILYYSIKDE